jgi:hypothetical protein
MVDVERGNVEDFFGPVALGRRVYAALAALVDELGPSTVRVTRSQVAFCRATGFCWVWLPGTYLTHPAAEVVVSIALPRQDTSPRWKESVRVSGTRWMHHLEMRAPGDVDAEVAAWLAEAYEAAG